MLQRAERELVISHMIVVVRRYTRKTAAAYVFTADTTRRPTTILDKKPVRRTYGNEARLNLKYKKSVGRIWLVIVCVRTHCVGFLGNRNLISSVLHVSAADCPSRSVRNGLSSECNRKIRPPAPSPSHFTPRATGGFDTTLRQYRWFRIFIARPAVAAETGFAAIPRLIAAGARYGPFLRLADERTVKFVQNNNHRRCRRSVNLILFARVGRSR